MILKPLSHAMSGSGTIQMNGYIFGGALITADGTNDATITIRENNSSGTILYEIVTKSPGAPIMPIKSNSKRIYYSISGTGAKAQLYEWII